jgi:hypothetical protein
MRKLAAVAVATGVLAGCAGAGSGGDSVAQPKPPPGITLRLEPGQDMAELDRRAGAYCSQYGKEAKRGKEQPAHGTGEQVVQYDCS